MELLRHLAVLLLCTAFMLANIYLGFLGTVVGEYRMNKKKGLSVPFRTLHRACARRFWQAHAADIAPTVAVVMFAHIGFAFFLLVVFGPVGEEKWVEPEKKIK